MKDIYYQRNKQEYDKLIAENKNIKQVLIDKKLGVHYDGGKRQASPWHLSFGQVLLKVAERRRRSFIYIFTSLHCLGKSSSGGAHLFVFFAFRRKALALDLWY